MFSLESLLPPASPAGGGDSTFRDLVPALSDLNSASLADLLGPAGHSFDFHDDHTFSQPVQPPAIEVQSQFVSQTAEPPPGLGDAANGADSPGSSQGCAPSVVMRGVGRKISSGVYYEPTEISDLQSRRRIITAGYHAPKILEFVSRYVSRPWNPCQTFNSYDLAVLKLSGTSRSFSHTSIPTFRFSRPDCTRPMRSLHDRHFF